MDFKCVLCDGTVLKNRKTVSVTRGLRRIIVSSRGKCGGRGDGVAARIQHLSELEVHQSCRNKYTRDIDMNESFDNKENVPVPAKRRSSEPLFDFELHCFICGKPAYDGHGSKVALQRRRVVHYIRDDETKQSFLKRGLARKDDKGLEVNGRLNTVLDIKSAKCRYHDDCQKDYFIERNSFVSPTRGRPVDQKKEAAFQLLCAELEKDEECQFSLTELSEKLNKIADEEVYPIQYLKDKLQKHYQKSAIITDFPGRSSVFCFKGHVDNFVYQRWADEKNENPTDMRTKIVKQAAKILHEEIRSKAFDMDSYTCGGEMEEHAVPSLLRTFLEDLIKLKSAQSKRVIEAIAQGIMQATRPRSFISPILLAIGVYIHRHLGTRLVIDILHSVGFCASYGEVQLFLLSATKAELPEPDASLGAFIQFVFDNADYNVRTIDGHHSFHNMGAIRATTPADTASCLPYTIPRLKHNKGVADLTSGRMEIKYYQKPESPGLKNVTIKELRYLRRSKTWDSALCLDYIWMCSYTVKPYLTPRPSWNGFMQVAMASTSLPHDASSIQALPFINLDPGNLSCIFTALSFAEDQAKNQGQTTCPTTFDQPLFVKACEIVAACNATGGLKGIVVMLGSFHTAMSYMGAIGRIMSGSGIEELWKTVYADNSVKQMVGGHYYSRAVRAHMLTQLALGLEILKEKVNCTAIINDIEKLHKDLLDGAVTPEDAAASDTSEFLFREIKDALNSLSNRNRTASLWVSYFEMVDILRCFIRAERTGSWDLYLESATAMIPYFHAAGHLNYAKAAHMHMQNMEGLKVKMDPQEYELFTERGYFVARRCELFWAGLALDLTIEQFLMRAIKSEGGLTRGRGITESTLTKFIDATPHCIPVCNSLESFCCVRSCKAEQHVELRESRVQRDLQDLEKFSAWLEDHPPFQDRPDKNQLVSLSTGFIADKSINCDKALEIGLQCINDILGSNFSDVKLKRSKQVKPLASMCTSVNGKGEEITFNPMQLLNRIVCVQDRLETPLSDFLTFELAPQSLAIFENGSLRKTDKSTLEKSIQRIAPCDKSLPARTTYVVDGGYLLRAAPWPQPVKYYSEICRKQVSWTKEKFKPSAKVVYDGYDGPPSTKSMEQKRRAAVKTSTNLTVELNKEVRTPKDNFLGNGHNKSGLIKLLTPALKSEGIDVVQATSDADALIVRTAIELSRRVGHVTVYATDTDVLVLLIALTPPDAQISMCIPGNPDRVHNIANVQQKLGPAKDVMLVVHALSGCDTTSAFFGKGKTPLLNLAKQKPEVRELMNEFCKPGKTQEEIAEVGERLILQLYNGSKCKTLDELRPFQYKKTVGKQKLGDKFDFRTLPPNSNSNKFHSLRVYLQVQEWSGNSLPPEDWGWKSNGDLLQPISMTQEPAPQSLMKMVRCGCKKGCERNCECRRAGFPCSEMCSECSGIDCTNVLHPTEEEISAVDDPDDPVPL